jgi:kynurenine formamidase
MNFVDNGADKFPDEGSRCVFSYLRIDRGTSSPCAVFGLPGYDKMELGSGSGMNLLGGGKGGEMKITSGSNLSGGLPSSKRWQFGHLIRNQADTCGDCSIRVVDMSLFGAETSGQKMMRFSEIGLTVDPSVNKLTTFTQPSEMPYLSMKGCVETLFIKTTEINSIKKKLQDVVKDETAVIFLTTDLFKLHDESLMKEAAAKHVCLGFFDDIQLPGDVRNILLRYNLTFFENLVRPEGFNDESIDENKLYYSFKFIFAPFAEGTSYGESLKSMDPPRKVNLADIVVYDSNEREVVDRCVKKNLIMLSHEWSPVDKVPITPNMSRPTLVDNGNKMMFFDHFGTHIDSPAHMDESNKMDIAHLPDTLDRPVCLRIDIPYRGQPSFTITKQHFVDWESASGVKIPSKSLVFLSTGFGAKNWDNVGDYQENFPGLSIDGARFLVEERGVVGIGIDSLTIDVYSVVKSSTFPVHEYLSSKNVIIIENIGGNDLSKMTYDGTAQCVLSYLRLEGATGSPVAVYGLLSDSPKEVKPIEPKPGQGGETITTETTTKKSAASSSAMPGHLLIGLTVISYPFLARF